jgi:uncharacterized protein (DUF697 family)
MRLPVDIKAVMAAATDVEAAAAVRVCATVLLDESAPEALAGHVRACFAGAESHARVTIGYMDGALEAVAPGADIGVIVAGAGLEAYVLAALQARAFREAGVPVMVVTASPQALLQAARAAEVELPEADVVAPVRTQSAAGAAVGAFRQAVLSRLGLTCVDDAPGVNSRVSSEGVTGGARAGAEPVELTSDTFGILDERMGKWIIGSSPASRLAFALAFPFVRRPLANEAIHATAAQNAAVGLVPVLPGADMPVMTLNQAKMLLEIAAAYGQPVGRERVRELVALVAGAFGLRNVARGATKFVPFAGPVISGAVGYAGTEAMGRAAADYFEAGGDLMGVAAAVQNARDDATRALGKFSRTPTGARVVAGAKDVCGQVVSKAASMAKAQAERQ